MLKDRLNKLFDAYDEAVQAIIGGILSIEQTYISMERPRVKDDVDYIVDLVARKKLQRAEKLEEN